jgi:hypothetical protein
VDALRAAIESGDIRRTGSFDPAWSLVYSELLRTFDRDRLQSDLRSISGIAPRQGRTNVLDTLDWILSVEALTPYLRGETDTIPDPPPDVSPDFAAAWADWSWTAETVRSGENHSSFLDETVMPLAAELMFASGDAGRLAGFMASVPVSLTSMSIANDMAKRLDRACESYLSHPTEALSLPGQPIFKFEG